MENDIIQIEIDNLLGSFKYYRLLSDKEIIESKDLILKFINHTESLIKDNIDFYQINEERILYFDNLYCSSKPLITDELEKAKEIMFILFNSIDFEKINIIYQSNEISFNIKSNIDKYLNGICYTKEEIDKNFEIAINLGEIDEYITDITKEWLDWFLDYWRFFQSFNHGTNLKHCLIIENYNELTAKILSYYDLFKEKLFDIPAKFYIDEFIIFDEFTFKSFGNSSFELSCKEFKRIIDSAIILLTELKTPCFIGNEGQKILIERKPQNQPNDTTSNNGKTQEFSDEEKKRKLEKFNLDDFEIKLVKYLIKGYSNLEIQTAEKRTESTVKNSLSKIYMKTNAIDENGRGSRNKAVEILRPYFEKV